MRAENLRRSIFFPGQLGRTRRQRRNDADIRIDSAQRVGVPAFRAARVEQKIVKVPKSEARGRPRPAKAAFAGADLEKDLAIDEQGEKLDPRKTLLPTQLL